MQKDGTELQFQWVLMNWCRTHLSTAPIKWYTYHQSTMSNQSWTQITQGRYCLRLATHGVSSQNPDHLVRWNFALSIIQKIKIWCISGKPLTHITLNHLESVLALGFYLIFYISKKQISQFSWVVRTTINDKMRWYVKRVMGCGFLSALKCVEGTYRGGWILMGTGLSSWHSRSVWSEAVICIQSLFTRRIISGALCVCGQHTFADGHIVAQEERNEHPFELFSWNFVLKPFDLEKFNVNISVTCTK